MLYEQNNLDRDCNYITELIYRIDKLQKEVLDVTDSVCIGCEIALMSSTYNTIPISIYTKCQDPFVAIPNLLGDTTNVFRIESIRCNRYLTLRLLEITTDTPPVIVATNRTIVIDMTEIIAIQCYEPITIEPCTTTT